MQERTLSVRFNNRLGNQMFEYAFACAMAERLCVDRIQLVGVDESRLGCFDLDENVDFISKDNQLSFVTHLVSNVMGKLAMIFEKSPQTLFFIEKCTQWFNNLCGVHFCLDGYIKPNVNLLFCKHIYCSGYFQSAKYFQQEGLSMPVIFTFKESIVNSCKSIADIISSCNAVCVHIRLGDYLTLPRYNVCDISYYRRAVQYVIQSLPDAKFFVFSDEPERAKGMLKDVDAMVIPESYNDQQSMYLRSLCKHHIISNSSFSWWMQYLAHHEKQIVVAPERWYNDDTPVDIYQSHWTLV